MVKQTVPEIKRVNLSSTLLTLKSMGVKDVLEFDYLDKPSEENIKNALNNLKILGAVNENQELTELGREMSKFPLEPNYSKALFASKYLKCQNAMIELVALLSSENVYLNVSRSNPEAAERAEKCHKQFIDFESDHMTLINVFREWVDKGRNANWA